MRGAMRKRYWGYVRDPIGGVKMIIHRSKRGFPLNNPQVHLRVFEQQVRFD